MVLETTKYNNNKRTVSGLGVTLFNNDVFIEVDTSAGPCSITLNTIPDAKWNTVYKLYIYDKSNNATANNITVNAPAGQEINQLPLVVINENGGGLVVRILGENKYTGTFSYNTGGGGGGTDEKVKVTAADTTANYLFDKISASNGLTQEIINAGANEKLQLNYVGYVTTVTFAELQALQVAQTIQIGMLYHITDVLFTDLGVYTLGITNIRVAENAHGSFLTPDYQNIMSGNFAGIWNLTTPPALAAGISLVAWNGETYLSLTGATGTDPSLDAVNWLVKTRLTDPDLYAPAIDSVIFDQLNGAIIRREDTRENIVEYALDGKGGNALNNDFFQWGSSSVNGNKVLSNSYLQNVNQIGVFKNNTITNLSYFNATGAAGGIRNNTVTNSSFVLCANIPNTCSITDNQVSENSAIQAVNANSVIINNRLSLQSILNISDFTGSTCKQNDLRSASSINANSGSADIINNYLSAGDLQADTHAGIITNNTIQDCQVVVSLMLAAGSFINNIVNSGSLLALNLAGAFDGNNLDTAAITATNFTGSFKRNILTQESVITMTNSSSTITDNILRVASSITAANSTGDITSNTITTFSSIAADSNSGTIFRNRVDDNSSITATNNSGTIGPVGDNTGGNIVNQRSSLLATTNTGDFCSNQLYDFSTINAPTNAFKIIKNTLRAGYLGASSNVSTIQGNAIITGIIDLGAVLQPIENKAHYQNTCNFETRLDMSDPAVYNAGTRVLTITVAQQAFGILELLNGAGNTIEQIQNISEFHDVTLINADVGNVTFTVTSAPVAASVGQILGSGSFTLVGRGASKSDSATFRLNAIYAEAVNINILI